MVKLEEYLEELENSEHVFMCFFIVPWIAFIFIGNKDTLN